jgi:glycosyltransferase involved in cell wall biosynthesis
MNVIHIFSRYGKYAASSRLRMYSLFNSLHIHNYINRIHPFFKYNRFKAKNILQLSVFVFSIIQSVFERIIWLSKIKEKDIVIIQYEFIPFFSSWAELFIKKRKAFLILDFDDAFYLSYDALRFTFLKNKYKEIIQSADLVVTGSPLLTKFISAYNANIIEIPTVVQGLYSGDAKKPKNNEFTIGWIGSPTTSKYIDQIAPVVYNFLDNHKEARLLLIGYSGQLYSISSNVEIIQWSEENEKNRLPQIDVGIMPLSDDEWTNGKCGFKLIQYMAAGKPTISTPLAANIKIDGGIGNLFATNQIEWSNSLSYFFINKQASLEVGLKNMEKAKLEYVFSAVLKKYENAFESSLSKIYFKNQCVE